MSVKLWPVANAPIHRTDMYEVEASRSICLIELRILNVEGAVRRNPQRLDGPYAGPCTHVQDLGRCFGEGSFKEAIAQRHRDEVMGDI